MIEVSEEQPEKAASPMLVTLLGIIVFLQPAISMLFAVLIIALHLLRLSYLVLPLSTAIEASKVQSENTPSPILVTLLGIVIEVRGHPLKVYSPILVTLLGIVIEVSEEQ